MESSHKERGPSERQESRRLSQSFRDAFRGVWLCLASERNMRIHAIACGYVLFFAGALRVSRGELACLLLAIGLVLGAEAMNTSVEVLCDRLHPGQDPMIGRVKDLAAGAVVLSAVFAALTGCAVFLRPELWTLLGDIFGTPRKLLLLAVSLAASALLVFAVPRRRR